MARIVRERNAGEHESDHVEGPLTGGEVQVAGASSQRRPRSMLPFAVPLSLWLTGCATIEVTEERGVAYPTTEPAVVEHEREKGALSVEVFDVEWPHVSVQLKDASRCRTVRQRPGEIPVVVKRRQTSHEAQVWSGLLALGGLGGGTAALWSRCPPVSGVSKDSTVYDNACLPDDKTMEKNMHIAGAVAVGVGALASLVFVTNVVRARDSQTIERIMFDTEASPWTTCLAGLGKLDLGVQTASGKFENRSLGKERTVRLNLADLGYGERIEQTALRQVPLTANFDGLYEVDGHIDLAVVRKEEQARVQREADLENGARHWPVVLSEARLVEACDEGSRWVAARSWTDTMTTMCKIVRKVAKDTRWLSQERLPVHRALVDFPGLGDAERDLVESDRESSRFYQTLVLDRAHGATRRVPPEFVKAYPKELMRQACRTACLAGRNDSEAPRDLDCRTSCLVDIP